MSTFDLAIVNTDAAGFIQARRQLLIAEIRKVKDIHDRDKRRDTGNRKIDCGRAHFDALGVDCEIETGIKEVLSPRENS